MDGLSAWHLWVVAGLALGVLEIKLSGFVTLWFALGAFLAAIVAGTGFGLELQLAAFSLVSLSLFAASRTLFQRFFMRTASHMKQGVEAMLGSEAIVAEALPATGFGTVRINGELWSARSLSGPLESGEWVRIEQVDGLKLLVRRHEILSPTLSRKEPSP
jgi:membrane protein implicated in regulation of membrane protease activity